MSDNIEKIRAELAAIANKADEDRRAQIAHALRLNENETRIYIETGELPIPPALLQKPPYPPGEGAT